VAQQVDELNHLAGQAVNLLIFIYGYFLCPYFRILAVAYT